ncbi:MAG: DpnD/PcfM family protein [Clostridia bacterium]|nr:DpnD/PcfM family protein [Clostridia bacterium]
MKEFEVEITEILQITVQVKAESGQKAVEAVRAGYKMGQYKIDSSDLVATEFDVKP